MNYLYWSLGKQTYLEYVILLLGSATCLKAWPHEFKQRLVGVVKWLFSAELSYTGFRQQRYILEFKQGWGFANKYGRRRENKTYNYCV